MTALSFTFWLLLGLVFYSYIGYALFVMLLNPRRKKNTSTTGSLPTVTLVIASYNEAAILEEKINNTSQLDYPRELLNVIIITDGSDDHSGSIISKHSWIRWMHDDQRKGKASAINRAMKEVNSQIVVLTDANTFLNRDCLLNIVPHFSDQKTGGVAGEKKLQSHSGMGEAEGWYWKYESFIKTLDARFYSVIGAAGELFALRKDLFQPIPEDSLLDDFVLSLNICLQGYIIRYEPAAYATEAPSISLAQERKRKIRIAAGAFQTLSRLSFRKLFSIPLFAFQFFSRRWLRWVVCPVAILLIFAINLILAVFSSYYLYDILFAMQLLFYFFAFAGWILIRQNRTSVITTIPFYFLFMNFCMLQGWIMHLQRKQTVLWAKAERK